MTALRAGCWLAASTLSAAVRADTGDRLVHSAGGLSEALLKLDELTDEASFVLGHNLIAFDLPHLAAAKPELRLLTLPAVDTLRLIPTVIDQNPCAHLRMPRDMIFHGWSMRLFQAWQHSATMSS